MNVHMKSAVFVIKDSAPCSVAISEKSPSVAEPDKDLVNITGIISADRESFSIKPTKNEANQSKAPDALNMEIATIKATK